MSLCLFIDYSFCLDFLLPLLYGKLLLILQSLNFHLLWGTILNVFWMTSWMTSTSSSLMLTAPKLLSIYHFLLYFFFFAKFSPSGPHIPGGQECPLFSFGSSSTLYGPVLLAHPCRFSLSLPCREGQVVMLIHFFAPAGNFPCWAICTVIDIEVLTVSV